MTFVTWSRLILLSKLIQFRLWLNIDWPVPEWFSWLFLPFWPRTGTLLPLLFLPVSFKCRPLCLLLSSACASTPYCRVSPSLPWVALVAFERFWSLCFWRGDSTFFLHFGNFDWKWKFVATAHLERRKRKTKVKNRPILITPGPIETLFSSTIRRTSLS